MVEWPGAYAPGGLCDVGRRRASNAGKACGLAASNPVAWWIACIATVAASPLPGFWACTVFPRAARSGVASVEGVDATADLAGKNNAVDFTSAAHALSMYRRACQPPSSILEHRPAGTVRDCFFWRRRISGK